MEIECRGMDVPETKKLPTWTPEGAAWSNTPIWDEEFEERWQALQRQGEQDTKPPTVKRPTARKPRTPRASR